MSSSPSDHITCHKYNLLIDNFKKIKYLNHTNQLKIKVYEIEDQKIKRISCFEKYVED